MKFNPQACSLAPVYPITLCSYLRLLKSRQEELELQGDKMYVLGKIANSKWSKFSPEANFPPRGELL
jgi:hypothetical protein